MPVGIKRKANENTYSLLRRFSDKIKRGRVLTLAKRNMYFQKKKNARQKKLDALRRKYNRERREYLIKIGKISEDIIMNNGNRFKKRS